MMTVGWLYGQRVQVLGDLPAEVHEAIGDGLHDEEVGDVVDASIGHNVQVGQYLMRTDSDGNRSYYKAPGDTIHRIMARLDAIDRLDRANAFARRLRDEVAYLTWNRMKAAIDEGGVALERLHEALNEIDGSSAEIRELLDLPDRD